MFRDWLGNHGSSLPLVAFVLFAGIAALVVWYIATDRRSGHRSRMERMALDDAGEDTGARP